MIYADYMATTFSYTMGLLFAFFIFYVLILLVNRIVQKYDEDENNPRMKMAKQLLDELKSYGESNKKD